MSLGTSKDATQHIIYLTANTQKLMQTQLA